jgi:hypothetical protein
MDIAISAQDEVFRKEGARFFAGRGPARPSLQGRKQQIHQRLCELKAEAIGYYANPYLLSALTQGWNEPTIGDEFAAAL